MSTFIYDFTKRQLLITNERNQLQVLHGNEIPLSYFETMVDRIIEMIRMRDTKDVDLGTHNRVVTKALEARKRKMLSSVDESSNTPNRRSTNRRRRPSDPVISLVD